MDKGAATVQPQSAPSNAGTEHLVSHKSLCAGLGAVLRRHLLIYPGDGDPGVTARQCQVDHRLGGCRREGHAFAFDPGYSPTGNLTAEADAPHPPVTSLVRHDGDGLVV